MFVDNLLFIAEQLQNVSAMDAVCALHHISTSGLLAFGYIVMAIYIYTYVYIYVYMMCMYIHDYAWVFKYIYMQLCIYTIIYRLRNVLADIKWTGKKKQQMDGPGRIRARNHLLPRLLQNAPGALRGGREEGEVAFPVLREPWKQLNTCGHESGCCTLFYSRNCSSLKL